MGAKVVTNYLSHMPSGASLRQIVHYAQFFRNGGRFSRYAKTYNLPKKIFLQKQFEIRYDHGRLGNLLRYGSSEPPEYDLSKVRVPISLYVGKEDSFGTPADAEKLVIENRNNHDSAHPKEFFSLKGIETRVEPGHAPRRPRVGPPPLWLLPRRRSDGAQGHRGGHGEGGREAERGREKDSSERLKFVLSCSRKQFFSMLDIIICCCCFV